MAKKTKKTTKRAQVRGPKKKVSKRSGASRNRGVRKTKKKLAKKDKHWLFTKENATELGRKGGRADRQPRFTTFLRQAIFSKDGGLTTDGHAILKAVLTTSKKGNVQMIKEMMSRLDGNVPNKIEATVDHGVLADLSDDDLASIVGIDPEDADEGTES